MISSKNLKKAKKRSILSLNKARGKMAEALAVLKYALAGYKVYRTGKGHDYHVVKRDLLTGKKVDEKYVEVKSGDSRLSKRQKKEKKRLGRKYQVERISPAFLPSSSLFWEDGKWRRRRIFG